MDIMSLQALCLSAALLTVTTFSIFILQKRKYWKVGEVKSLPSPPFKLPIIGHLHLLTDMPHHIFTQLAKKLGPIIYLQLGQVPTIVISSAHHAQLVLKTHEHVFSNRPQPIAPKYLSFNYTDVTFSPYGPYWRQARKICVNELFNPKRVNSFQLVRNEEVSRLLATLSSKSNTEVDMGKLFFDLANDILCLVAFGKRFVDEAGSGSGGGGQKCDFSEVLTETEALFGGFFVADFFPKWEWVTSVSGMKRRLQKNLDDLRVVCDEVIEQHLNNPKSSDREDFLDVLLRVQRRGDSEVPITDDNVKSLVLAMFVAGTDTTSTTLEWTLTELARHPSIMKKVQAEVRKVVASSDKKGRVDESDLQHLPYMKTVIKESMRLHPALPLIPRASMEECTIDGYVIPDQARVFINTYAIGRDPNLWENPLEFNPERFVDMSSNIDVVKGQDFKFLPFGAGRRGCPGFSFGIASVEITLAKLLCHFDWALPNGVGADDVDLTEIFGLVTTKKNSLVLVPTVNKDYPLS